MLYSEFYKHACNYHVTVNQKETPDTKHQPRYLLKVVKKGIKVMFKNYVRIAHL